MSIATDTFRGHGFSRFPRFCSVKGFQLALSLQESPSPFLSAVMNLEKGIYKLAPL